MIQALLNVFKIRELRTKILFTIAMLVVYRVGFWIPIPGVDQKALTSFFQNQATTDSAIGKITQFVAVFSGGSLQQSTIFGLGIMPYISAGIIFQLLGSVLPSLKKLQEEGPTGRQKIQEWTRYATIALCIVQAFTFLQFMTRASGGNEAMVPIQWATNPMWWVMATITLTAGTLFLMWLGEQIDKHGIGNGVSLIIMAGILTGMPSALEWIISNSSLRETLVVTSVFGKAPSGFQPQMGWLGIASVAVFFVLVIAGAVLMTVAQRRIPVQQAKHTRGRRVYGGQKSYLPLRVNHGGVMPVIFASSLMIFPSVLFSGIVDGAGSAAGTWWVRTFSWLATNFAIGQFLYTIIEIVMIYFFSYFWITVQFNPEEMAKQLKEHGSFIPGLRPGPRTAEYLESVMERVTFVGAGFLSVLAVLPAVINSALGIDYSVTQFLGGTGLLIVVSVCLDFVQRVEANLLMRNYAGFLGGSDDGKGPRIRGPRG